MLKITHTWDCHLWLTISGTTREEDFYNNFHKIIDDVLAKKPKYHIDAWDLFHQATPSNRAIAEAVSWYVRLAEAWIQVIILDGNHTTPRQSTTTNILDVFKDVPNLHIVHGDKIQTVDFDDIRFTCLPHINDQELFRKELSTCSDYMVGDKVNLFVSHFWITTKDNEYDELTDEISWVNILKSDIEQLFQFDYVAIGHYHKNFNIKNIYYAWSIEHTSFNQKDYDIKYNVISFDEKNKYEVEKVDIGSRKMIDLWKIDCSEYKSMGELLVYLEKNIDKRKLKGAIVKIDFMNMKTDLNINFDGNLVYEFFSDVFYINVSKNRFIDEKEKEISWYIDTSKTDYVVENFKDFIESYTVDEFIDRWEIQKELEGKLKKIFN